MSEARDTITVEPVPEKAFLGRWTGPSRADIQTIDIQSGQICQVTMGDRLGRNEVPGAFKAFTSTSGEWFLSTSEILIDINDKNEWNGKDIYRGRLDPEGNLVLERGEIYTQGSWHSSGGPPMFLKKAQ